MRVDIAAFFSALIIGISLHYHKIVQNEFHGYPQEWFPSVSATIGDRYPERSFFMIFIAITSGTENQCSVDIMYIVLTWYRPTICPGRLVVSSHTKARPKTARIRRHYGPSANSNLRRLDIYHIHG
jgi:hypothetical protein